LGHPHTDAAETEQSGYWVLRYDNKLLVALDAQRTMCFPYLQLARNNYTGSALMIGIRHDSRCYAADLDTLPEGLEGELVPLRSLLSVVAPEDFFLASRGVQLLNWQRNHKFCGRCAARTGMKTGQFAMECPSCGLVSYPKISPAVMVLIRRGDEVLLARGHHYRPGIYSALAGFVEAGETLEQCAVREVREEVGIEIASLRYFGSQSWPFPDSLMVAYFADYAGGDITPDPEEIEDAQWFHCRALPPLPEPVSLAYRLICAGSK
jgi:NAD+ diphosphatase